MTHEQAHWEMPPSIQFPHDLAPDGVSEAVQPVPGDGDTSVLPLSAADTILDASESHDDTPDPQASSNEEIASKAWEALIFRTDIDSSKIAVNTSDATRITSDKYSTKPQRATRIAHDAMAKLAEVAGIPSELVTTAEQLEETYYEAAAYLFAHEKRSVQVDVIGDMIDEGLAPILNNTPVPIAKRYVKLTQYRPEASVALYITKLWAADMYRIDLPYAYTAIRELKRD